MPRSYDWRACFKRGEARAGRQRRPERYGTVLSLRQGRTGSGVSPRQAAGDQRGTRIVRGLAHHQQGGGRRGHAIQARPQCPPSKIVRAGYLGADPRDDLVRFILGDLNELVLQIATLSRDQ
jgi:hypothetical protein